MSDAAAAGNGGGEGQAQQGDAGGGQDLSQMAEQLQSLAGSHEQLRELLASQPWSQQDIAEAEGQDEGLDMSWLQEYAEPGADADSLAQQLQQVMEKQIQDRIAPLQEQTNQRLQEMEVRREADELVAEFPELADPEVHKPVLDLAKQMAEQLGNPALADSPKFWRMAYMMGRAAEAANEEGAESPRAAHLEGGGGATPSGPQVDLGDLIIGGGSGGRGSGVLPF